MENELKKLISITKSLKKKYDRNFPLDGRLVGDIGEILVQKQFLVDLLPENYHCYDAVEIGTKRQLQIKASFKYNFSYPYKFNPDYYMAVHVNEDATLEVIYNGKGKTVKDYIDLIKKKACNNTWYPLSKNVLTELNKKVKKSDRIKMRKLI